MVNSKTSAGPDVGDLRDQELPKSPFPAVNRHDFRVYLAPEVHGQIVAHGKESKAVEVCGVLVGTWGQDENGPFAAITASIRGEAADNQFAEVTFTHQTWANINAEMDSRYADLSIVGWYHTHPDFGIFLSDRDRFIQEHFFSGSGQVAYVLDPVRDIEGIFAWRNGSATLIPHYWIGNRLRVAPEDPPARAPSKEQTSLGSEVALSDRSIASMTKILTVIVALLFGYILGSSRSTWEQQRLVEGTVAHYGIWKGLRPGLENQLKVIHDDLGAISLEMSKLDDPASKNDSSAKHRERIVAMLGKIRQNVLAVQLKYGLNTEEKIAVQQLITERLAPLSSAPIASSPKASEMTEKTKGDAPKTTSKEKDNAK